MDRTLYFRKNWLMFGGILGETKLILRIWGAKKEYFQGAEVLSLGIWGDKCIIIRDQGSTDPPWGLRSY